jgi:hypothetical protein
MQLKIFALFGLYVKDAIAPIAEENGLTTSGGFYPFNCKCEFNKKLNKEIFPSFY